MEQEQPSEASIGRLLAQVCGLNHTRMHALLEGIGLYRGQPFVLRVLWENEGLTQSELSDTLYRTPATITNMLQRMEKAGLVERRADPSDQRVLRVYPTPSGRAIRGQVERVWREIEARAFCGFSPEECAALGAYLVRVRENLLADPTSAPGKED